MRNRYAGLAEYYEEFAADSAGLGRSDVVELLGPGQGLCLDVGCGTGLYVDAIAATGRVPIGIDYSSDQLEVARSRSTRVAQADARRLPFADSTFQTVIALWISTDIEPVEVVLVEAARVLRRGGTFLFYGVHPCFNGPLVQNLEGGARLVHPGYRQSGHYESAEWWSPAGIRSRVGMFHVPLAPLLQAVIDAPLTIRRVVEPRENPVPFILAVVASKP